MKVESKIKKIFKIIILLAVIIFGISLTAISSETSAAILNGKQKAEIFKDDAGILNKNEHPTHLFVSENIYLFCSAHGWDVNGYMTATEAHYWAFKNKAPEGVAMYDPNNPYMYYRRSASVGVMESHRYNWGQWVNLLDRLSQCNHHKYGSYKEGLDDNSVFLNLKATLPGIGKPAVKSIEYVLEETWDASEKPGAMFVLTQQKIYESAAATPKDAASGAPLTEKEKELGYFNIDEKQGALWNKNLGINEGKDNDIDDRNLGEIAEHYEEFYKKVKNEGYESLVEVLPVKGESQDIEESTMTLDGDTCKTYKYKNTNIEIDTSAKCHVLGPFCVDYTLDDENADIYSSYIGTDGKPNEVKYNAIERIKVFNQNKVDIETLGGSFKVAYSYNGAVTEENEGKLHRISDKYYYEFADYKEIPAFESRKPFYIIVYRGSMSASDFTGFYAKIDFQYLKDVTGTIYKYRGDVYKYYYTETRSIYTTGYSGSYTDHAYDWIDDEGREQHSHTRTELGFNANIRTWTYTLNRRKSGEKAQSMVGYSYDGNRVYDTYSIVLTTEWENPKEPKIELYKTCSSDGSALYGAKYDVTLNISGTSKHGVAVNKTINLTGITDERGILKITTSQLEGYGVYLGTLNGTINATFKEVQAPAGHILGSGDFSATFSVSNGEISPSTVSATNEHGGTPVIQIAKVNSAGNLIEEAMFDIGVRYTNASGNLINIKNNIIRGQTKGGYLNLTREDFMNMPVGFDIKNYTGTVTLQMVEVAVTASGYSISPKNLSIALEFKNGRLVKYSENTSEDVLVHYLYDDPLTNIYNWINGNGTLYPYVQNKVNEWIKIQQDRTDMEYDDILNFLKEYIENDVPEDGGDLDEWKVSTLAGEITSNTGGDIIRLIVEDQPGDFNLPDIPDEPPSPLLMKLGGKVFLDQTVTKEGEKISDGNLTPGELGLYGIEVTLHESDGSLATLYNTDGSIKTGCNPTFTDRQGYYSFKGLDPFNKYYVTFKYNGIEYEATTSSEAEYNSDLWKVTSKGGEINTGRDNYKTVSNTNQAYDYDEIASYYNPGNTNSSKDPDVLKYIERSMATAKAGYSSGNPNGTYAHSSLGDRFMLDSDFTNSENTVVDFAGDRVPTILSGQMQVHLGLKERPSTDLELHSDIVETTVSMNRHDTKYEYGKNDAGYKQYIYEEDYNYATSPNSDGIAYYTEDNVHFYITYQIDVTNTTGTSTRLQEIVNYYNSEFSWKSSYTTTKGNVIPGIKAWYGDNEVSAIVNRRNRSSWI